MSDPITEPVQVTPRWLTEVFRQNYNEWQGRVASVHVAATKTLQYSRIAHLAVEYACDNVEQLPERVFLKLSPSASGNGGSEITDSEIVFYRSIGSETGSPPLIRCYDTAYAVESRQFHILLDDLSDTHFQTEDGKHPSPIYSELAVRCLARFHARWWEHPNLGNGVGKIFNDNWLKGFLAELEKSVTRFVEFLGDDLAADRRRAYERLLRSGRTIWGRLTDRTGLTVTHGDTHWWNFLHPNDRSSDETRILDWQLWHIDMGARDLAFLVALGGFADRQREQEMSLVRAYHETLLSCGVTNYPWSVFWDDYRWSAIRNLNIPVVFRSRGKHPDTWRNALERAFQSYDELNCDELLN